METIIQQLQNKLQHSGLKSSVVSIRHLKDLQTNLDNLLRQGILKSDFYDEIIARYQDFDYNLEPPANFPEAKTIFITAAPQPKVKVIFNLAGKKYPVIIPPTYIHDTDDTAYKILSQFLSTKGYKISKAYLPEKALAVHCGLATYGKNNIAYIDCLGSFFRLKAFYSDIPSNSNNWQEFKMLDRCDRCVACYKSCPTKAISNERFLIDATKCLTYFNEGENEFPDWINQSWHNCLMGCMICQDVCPVNKDVKNWVTNAEEFSDQETKKIIDGVQQKQLPQKMMEKLRRINMLDHYALLQRNLGVLIDKYVSQNS